ncbi:MAG TPA: SpoIIE family protein phosphatase [Jatrophihabitantaceae bacterium]|nr:SpoIIE family protein phosphatase [Jatrophihabitantaceae bacterium]
MSDVLSRVLLIEDDEGDALLVRECLLEAGVSSDDVIWRRTLSDGIDAMSNAPGCVLLDLGLPDAEGLGALHRLVSRATATPIIVLTGRNDRTGVDALAAGAQDYLVKDDITPELLDRSIRYAVERTRAQTTELQLRAEQMNLAENARLERGLLPRPLLRSSLVSCATYYQPGRNMAVLGGDFFDVVETSDGAVRAVIGDVMGHGPDEAALGVHLRVAWRTLVLAGVADDQILVTLSRLLSAESGGSGGFVTALDITINPSLEATLRVAGHPPPLLCTPAGSSYLQPEVGPPLGVEGLTGAARRWPDTGGWPVWRTQLSPGASLILYTDGLLDAYRIPASRSSLGVDELLDATSAALASGESVSSWIPTIVGSAPTRSADDTAVVVLTVLGHGVR